MLVTAPNIANGVIRTKGNFNQYSIIESPEIQLYDIRKRWRRLKTESYKRGRKNLQRILRFRFVLVGLNNFLHNSVADDIVTAKLQEANALNIVKDLNRFFEAGDLVLG